MCSPESFGMGLACFQPQPLHAPIICRCEVEQGKMLCNETGQNAKHMLSTENGRNDARVSDPISAQDMEHSVLVGRLPSISQ